MNSINTDLERLRGTTIPVGDDPIVGSSSALAAPVKILAEPSVTVSEVSVDTLVDRLTLEYIETQQKLNLQRLTQTLAAISARQEITDQRQKDLAQQSAKLSEKLEAETATRDACKEARDAAQEELDEAKAQKDPPATKEQLDKLQKKVDEASEKFKEQDATVSKMTAELKGLISQMDDSLKAELAAGLATDPLDLTVCLKVARARANGEFKDVLPSEEALARLLGGEKMQDLLTEKLGIRA